MKNIATLILILFVYSLGSSVTAQAPEFSPIFKPDVTPASILSIEDSKSSLAKFDTEHSGAVSVTSPLKTVPN